MTFMKVIQPALTRRWRGGAGICAILAIATCGLKAQDQLQVLGSTPTQALVYYVAPTAESVCTLELSERNDFSSLANDVNANLFAGANLDTNRSLIAHSPARLVVLGRRKAEPSGKRFYSRALKAASQYYLRVTCDNNSQASVQATVLTTEIAGITPEGLPFHPQAFGHMAVPDFDWSDRSVPVIDPQTGVEIYRVSDPKDFAVRVPLNFPTYFGGQNWTSPGNVTSGNNSSLATTGDVEPIFVVADTSGAELYGGFASTGTLSHPATDLAIQLRGRGTGSSAADRQIEVCISVDSGQTCFTDAKTITLPSGSPQDLGLTPSSFPKPIFEDWSRPVTREYYPSRGLATVTAGMMTATKDFMGLPFNVTYQAAIGRFHQEWAPGSKIRINNSSPTCPNNYCTIDEVLTQNTLRLRENLTLGENGYLFAGLGFRIRKLTNNSEVSVSGSFHVAKSFMMHQSASSGCSASTVTTNVSRTGEPLETPVKGFLCLVSWTLDSGGRLYFVGEKVPEIRLLSLFKQPASIPNHVTADLPSSPVDIAMVNFPTFEVENPNIFYTTVQTRGGSVGMFRLRYTGDYREDSSIFWNSTTNGSPSPGLPTLEWDNITKSDLGKDLRSQILANSSYDESRWGNLATSLSFTGFTEKYSIFSSTPISGQDSACWIFAFDLQTGNLSKAWNTLAGVGPGVRGLGCHSVQLAAGRIMLAVSNLDFKTNTRTYGGPFRVTPSGVLRGGVISPNTALPFQGNTTTNQYDRACPSDISPVWQQQGATGNECVTMMLPSEPCSNFATENEKLWSPCPSDANQSWLGAPLAEGDTFYDPAAPIDSELLMVVRRRNLPEGIEVVMLRDAVLGYSCQSTNPRGRDCLGYAEQQIHQSGFTMTLVSRGGVILIEPSTGQVIFEEPNLTRGHFSYRLLTSGNHNFAGVGSGGRYVARYDAKPSQFGRPSTSSFAQWPSFAKVSSAFDGVAQSYLTVAGGSAGPFERKFASDWRHLNGSVGVAPEAFAQVIGPEYQLTLEPNTTSVYKVTPIPVSYDPKRTPLLVWAGKYVMREKSSALTGDTLTDAHAWHYCYALRTGECRTGSTAGSLYVSAPKLEPGSNRCQASQISYRTLCVFSGISVLGQIMQIRIDKNDPAGLWQRKLGFGLTSPGSQYVYSNARPSSDGKSIFATAWNLQGVYSVPIQLRLPPWRQDIDTVNRTTYIPVEISASPGSVVEFGYEEFGAPDKFFCTPRAETCKVSAARFSEDNPFSWQADPLAPSATEKISIPALPGRMLYYRVITGENTGGLQAVPVP